MDLYNGTQGSSRTRTFIEDNNTVGNQDYQAQE